MPHGPELPRGQQTIVTEAWSERSLLVLLLLLFGSSCCKCVECGGVAVLHRAAANGAATFVMIIPSLFLKLGPSTRGEVVEKKLDVGLAHLLGRVRCVLYTSRLLASDRFG